MGTTIASFPRFRPAGMARTFRLGAAAALLALAGAAAAAEPGERPPPTGMADEYGRETPAGAMRGYLVAGRQGDWERAAQYLNLEPLDVPKRRGPSVARKLKIVLDRTLWVDLGALSAEPTGLANDGLPARRDRVGSIQTQRGPVDVLLERVDRGDGAMVWKIASSTVAQAPALYDEFGYGWLGEWLPSAFFRTFGLEVQLWQWAAILLLVAAAYFLSWLVTRAAFVAARPVAARSRTDIDDRMLEATAGPLRLLAAVLLFAAGTWAVGLSVPAQRFFFTAEKLAAVLALTWLAVRLIDLLGEWVERRLDASDQMALTTFVPLGRRTVKFVIFGLVVLMTLDSLGYPVTTLIAGLGVTGLAVALAAQKPLENLFAAVTLAGDRPVKVGDFCRFGDRIGTIEEIGLRSTRVRTLDRTLVTVPNAHFATLELENFAKRDKIWFHPRLGLRYETTPEQLRYVLVEIRRMLYAHPRVGSDAARIRFVGFGDFSLDLEIFAYVLATDFGEYLEVAEDLNLRIMDIVDTSGTGFAFPSNTTYLARDEGVDGDKTRAAEETVRGWRDRDELCLPAFPPAVIAGLENSLDYPEKGSAVRVPD